MQHDRWAGPGKATGCCHLWFFGLELRCVGLRPRSDLVPMLFGRFGFPPAFLLVFERFPPPCLCLLVETCVFSEGCAALWTSQNPWQPVCFRNLHVCCVYMVLSTENMLEMVAVAYAFDAGISYHPSISSWSPFELQFSGVRAFKTLTCYPRRSSGTGATVHVLSCSWTVLRALVCEISANCVRITFAVRS